MGQPLTVIMYHYVRDLKRSRYPRIKGLSIRDFRAQIEYVQKRYNVISGEHLLAAVTEGAELPPEAALLTFDDGYLDHYTTVFPILDEFGLPGCFFPPARAVLDREVLAVNKIHYVLASAPDAGEVETTLFRLMDEWGGSFDLRSPEAYREIVAGDHRFDAPQVVLVKRLLQRELPGALRRRILDRLFERYVDVSESVLAEELYMTLDQLRVLRRHGMYVGGHGDQHAWMDRLGPDEQRADIDRTRRFLRKVGTPDRWIMCYPYGAHDASLRACLRDSGAAVGPTTGADVADLGRDNALALPRLDTNDVPVPADLRA